MAVAKPTYSIAALGAVSHNPGGTAIVVILPDTSVAGNVLGDPSKTPGGFQSVTSDGDLILGKTADGGLKLFRINAERSTALNIVLEALGP